jgi:hypothetical protein
MPNFETGVELMKKVKTSDLKLGIFKNIMSAIVLWGLFFPARAEAYIDPYSGGFLLQIIVGGIAGLITIYKFFGNKIKKFFNQFKKNNG